MVTPQKSRRGQVEKEFLLFIQLDKYIINVRKALWLARVESFYISELYKHRDTSKRICNNFHGLLKCSQQHLQSLSALLVFEVLADPSHTASWCMIVLQQNYFMSFMSCSCLQVWVKTTACDHCRCSFSLNDSKKWCLVTLLTLDFVKIIHPHLDSRGGLRGEKGKLDENDEITVFNFLLSANPLEQIPWNWFKC